MKRFEFRLEQVLKWKKQRERLAELRQMEAMAAQDAARAAVVALEQQLAEAAAILANLRDADAASWRTRHEQSMHVGQLLEAAQAREAETQRQLEEAKQQRKQIAIEVEVLQTLRQQQWDAHRQEMAKEVQEQIDEMGLRRWMAAKAEGGNEPD